jgi:L-ascorbate metabolism protein UlaG (beta-lactamase superfamily)
VPVPLRITHVGTATLLLEVAGLRILTDPALDPAGTSYRFALGLGSTKTEAPALPPGGLGKIDAVLVSHDHHADNLDPAGRALWPDAGRVVTTRPGARRLGGNALGLVPWQATELANGVKVTATPARHGPPGITLVDSQTIGFFVEVPGASIWISGDTVYFSGIDEIARRIQPSLAVVHVGAVAFPLTGPLRFTFTGDEAARAAKGVGARTIIPVHYEGWAHFREPRAATEQAFARAGVADRVRWLTRGEPTDLQL